MRLIAAIAPVLILSGCADGVSPRDSLHPAHEIVARFPYNPERGRDYIVPETVSVNTTFDVVVYPALACGSDAIPAIAVTRSMTADVTARAMIPEHREGTAFTCEGRLLNRSIGRVSFSEAGRAIVRLHGRTMGTDRDTTISVGVLVRSQ